MKHIYSDFLKTFIFILILSALPEFTFASDKINPKKLKGYEVKFDYKGHPKEREVVYKYYKDKEEPDEPTPVGTDSIGIDLYDINNDGKKEILVYLAETGYCGSGGCKFDIFIIEEEGKLSPISGLPITGEQMKILKSSNLGYHDLLFSGDVIWRWNGKEYDLYKIIKEGK